MIATVVGMACIDVWTAFSASATPPPADLWRDLSVAAALALIFGGAIAQQFQRHSVYKAGFTLSLAFFLLAAFL